MIANYTLLLLLLCHLDEYRRLIIIFSLHDVYYLNESFCQSPSIPSFVLLHSYEIFGTFDSYTTSSVHLAPDNMEAHDKQ